MPRKSNKLYFSRGGMGTPAKWIARSDATGNRPLYRDAPDHPHTTFSLDSRKILIESGLLHNFTNLNLMTIAIPFGLGR